MRHHRLITRKPQLAQEQDQDTEAGSNYEVWKDFLKNLLDQVIEFIFIQTS